MKHLALFILPLSLAAAEPRIIDDSMLLKAFESGIGAFTEDDSLPSADDLAKSVPDLPTTWKVEKPDQLVARSADDVEASVYLIGSVYKCGRCDRWHPGGVATAWSLSRDGLMVTNYHVFEKAKGGAMGVVDREGTAYPIVEILAGDEASDVALFRIKGEGLTPLAIGDSAQVGSRVQVLSNPERRFFMHTYGDVSRYHRQPAREEKPESIWMSITADYAKGSSGGPVMDMKGNVVGMVASTQSIYYESNNGKPKGPLQMVVKNCVPVSKIRGLLGMGAEDFKSSGARLEKVTE